MNSTEIARVRVVQDLWQRGRTESTEIIQVGVKKNKITLKKYQQYGDQWPCVPPAREKKREH